MDGKKKTEGVRRLWEKYKFVALVVLIGVVLLLWPSGRRERMLPASTPESGTERDVEGEMEDILSKISGVGQVQVMLTVDTEDIRQLAQDTELSYKGSAEAPEDYERRSETVLTDGDDGEEPVVTQTRRPTYRGALVVCQGGDRAEVKLAVTEAVTALTGLTADRVTVAKWQ